MLSAFEVNEAEVGIFQALMSHVRFLPSSIWEALYSPLTFSPLSRQGLLSSPDFLSFSQSSYQPGPEPALV
jgi:hypothetical protein